MLSRYLCITFGDANPHTLKFKILHSNLASRWERAMEQVFRFGFAVDNPTRFSGFDDVKLSQSKTLTQLSASIRIINSYGYGYIEEPNENPSLKYLQYVHEKFVSLHGHRSSTPNKFNTGAPTELQTALANINLCVHELENLLSNYVNQQCICTWYKVQLEEEIPLGDMIQDGTLYPKFGGVYLNYPEVGKTLSEMAKDNDQIINKETFQPFKTACADIIIRFDDAKRHSVEYDINNTQNYYLKHKEYFLSRGVNSINSPLLLPLHFPVAQLETTLSQLEVLAIVKDRQYIKEVNIQ